MGWPCPKNFPLSQQQDKRPYQMLGCMTERRQTGTEKVLKWHLSIFWSIFTVLIYASRWIGHRLKIIPISSAVNEIHVPRWLCLGDPAWLITARRWCLQHTIKTPKPLPVPRPFYSSAPISRSPSTMHSGGHGHPSKTWKSSSTTDQDCSSLTSGSAQQLAICSLALGTQKAKCLQDIQEIVQPLVGPRRKKT